MSGATKSGPGAPAKYGEPMVGRTLKLPPAWWDSLWHEARQRSAPRATVSVQDLIRTAIREVYGLR